jgi:hypothetical protein
MGNVKRGWLQTSALQIKFPGETKEKEQERPATSLRSKGQHIGPAAKKKEQRRQERKEPDHVTPSLSQPFSYNPRIGRALRVVQDDLGSWVGAL